MDCRSCEKYINDYLDGGLSKKREKKFRSHLEECKTCNEEFESYLAMTKNLENLEELAPSEGFEARILAELQPYQLHAGQRSDMQSTEQRQPGSQPSNLQPSDSQPSSLQASDSQPSNRHNSNVQTPAIPTQRRDRIKDLFIIAGYFITLFVVISLLRNVVFQNVDWISGILVAARVFREVFDGWIFQGILSFLVIYPIRIFHWALESFSQMSFGGLLIYSFVLINLVLLGTFSQIFLRKLAKGEKGR